VDGQPTVLLSPDNGPAGKGISIRVTGFGPDEFITVKLGEQRIASVRTDQRGTAEWAITVPASYADQAPDTMSVIASGQTSGRVATAEFRLTAP
jgi:hypothetical protein